MKSLAAVCWAIGEPWSVEEIEVDPPGPGEIVVEWAAAGLCHSDESLRNGARVPAEQAADRFPLLGGHEGAGIVVALGPGVTEVVEGDHVVASFSPSCGVCRYCASGRSFICNENKHFGEKGQLEDGANKHRVRGEELFVMAKLGTFAERTVVSQRSVIRVDDDVSLDAACLLSCGVPTGWGSAVERGGTRPGDVVVVVGIGGLGYSAVQGARVAGAGHIVAVDPLERRRKAARNVGATFIAASMADAREHIMHLTNGQGADVVVLTPGELTGDMLTEALGITGKGATCVLTGLGASGPADLSIDLGELTLFHKQIRGCLFGSLDPRSSTPRLLGLYRQGQLDLDGMITHYPLTDINTALSESYEGINIRGVLTMNGFART